MGWKKENTATTYAEPDAYVNLAIQLKDGSTSKLDRGLRLYFDGKNGARHSQLAEMLQTEDGIAKFVSKLVVTCNYAGGDNKAEYDFD
jgi:hypothetical protein